MKKRDDSLCRHTQMNSTALPEQNKRTLVGAQLSGFTADIQELRAYYRAHVLEAPSTTYADHSALYDGWSILSRDGSIEDGVRYIKPGTSFVRGSVPTPLCTGYM